MEVFTKFDGYDWERWTQMRHRLEKKFGQAMLEPVLSVIREKLGSAITVHHIDALAQIHADLETRF